MLHDNIDKNKYMKGLNFENDKSNSNEISMELIDNSRMKLISTWLPAFSCM